MTKKAKHATLVVNGIATRLRNGSKGKARVQALAVARALKAKYPSIRARLPSR